MNSYKSRNSLPQIVVALIATVMIGSVALVGTVDAAPTRITAQSQA